MTTGCERFENEALLLLEQGQPLDDHFSTCPDCLEARAAYDRLRDQLSQLGEDDEPAPDWQARVWERIEQRKKRRWWTAWVAPAALAAAAMAAFFLVWLPSQKPAGLHIEIEAGTDVRRGAEAHPGDTLRLEATTGGARHSELRVYRNDTELILRCATDDPCSVVFDGVGRYQPLLLFSESPLPAPTSDLEKDTGAALDSGAEIEMGPEVAVR